MSFNEDSRVKIPALIHLTRLGYEYILKTKHIERDISCNIFDNIFLASVKKLNPSAKEDDLKKLLQDLILKLENDDLGKDFYLTITGSSNFKIIDFDNFANNSLHYTTELIYKNGDDEFRPDITIIINGLPLIFIEVKKPNNPEGVLAERQRMSARFKNEKFKKFINLTQFMIYSNNMEYDDTNSLQGAFYATGVKTKRDHNFADDLNITFNYFREEEILDYKNILQDVNLEIENKILADNNLVTLKNNQEFIFNKNPDTPTNRILTSLLSKDRISFIVKYAIAYVETDNNIEKHIMRYPQIFATLAIGKKLSEGVKKGVIWHTQGSGKTALAFYNVKYLTDYYQKQNTIARFFFIVDRLDLLQQAKLEFLSRGLSVNVVNSREEFVKFMDKVTSINNDSGKLEITVINIQKFSEDSKVCQDIKYNVHLQNIYFLDEVHRSYNPSGSFLANLINSDKNAILIGLTGTPLLQKVVKDYSTKILFGEYIHKYYYNQSIDDGYTLRLIREEISTSYKIQLQQALAKLKIKQGSIEQNLIYSHDSYIKPMLDYIVEDLTNFRKLENDNISAMVICKSSEQAKNLFTEFEKRYGKQIIDPQVENKDNNPEKLKAILILHDIHNKEIRDKQIKAYKRGFYNIVFVYNMLLTGFDAPILKKLYIARKIENHNLLQALTRVNRPYNNFKYGYVVDFVDISDEFKKTNEDYFKELAKEYGELENFNKLFKTEEEITNDIENIKNILFEYNIKNKEIFCQQISSITDKNKLLEIVKVLRLAKELYNIILYTDNYKSLNNELDFKNLSILHIEAQNRLNLINQSELLNSDNANLINLALEDIIFKFTKLSEEELIIVDKLRDQIRKTREAMSNNFDQKDDKFILLKEEFERIFKNKDFSNLNQEEINNNINKLEDIYKKVNELNRTDNLIQDKYLGDKKYARVHKRLLEKNISIDKQKLFAGLFVVKEQVDDKILHNKAILNNEAYFNDELKTIIMQEFIDKNNLEVDYKYINNLIVKEYIDEYRGL